MYKYISLFFLCVLIGFYFSDAHAGEVRAYFFDRAGGIKSKGEEGLEILWAKANNGQNQSVEFFCHTAPTPTLKIISGSKSETFEFKKPVAKEGCLLGRRLAARAASDNVLQVNVSGPPGNGQVESLWGMESPKNSYPKGVNGPNYAAGESESDQNQDAAPSQTKKSTKRTAPKLPGGAQ